MSGLNCHAQQEHLRKQKTLLLDNVDIIQKYTKKYNFIKVLNPKIDDETLKDYLCLAMGMVMVSQGVPFIHAGQEFLRTKNGEHNSYILPDSINKLDWKLMEKNILQELQLFQQAMTQ